MTNQPNDGSGRAPVVIVRPTTSVTSGVAVTQKLVSAAVAFGNLLKGTYGPNGLDKMLYKTTGETAVTNDGAKIVAELLVKHPAAKAFVQLAESQENACGDGVTGCLIFASGLMQEAGVLLEKGLHPLILAKGYQEAMVQTIEIISNNALPVSIDDEAILHSVAQTSMVGTSVESMGEKLAELVVKAVKQIAKKTDEGWRVDTEQVRLAKKATGSLSETNLINGIIIQQAIELENLPRSLKNGKIVVLSCPLEIEKTSYEAEIEISSAEQWVSFMAAEEAYLTGKAKAIIDSGASIVCCAETIDTRIIHRFAEHGIFAMASLEKSGATDIAIATGALMVDSTEDIDNSVMGSFENMWVEAIDTDEGVTDRLYLDAGKKSGLTTIDVCGVGGTTTEEFIRGIYDGLNSVARSIESGFVVCGGGNPHITAALLLREYAESISGRERLAIEAFARALEAIPATLFANSGSNTLDGLLRLRSIAKSSGANCGVSKAGKATELSDVWECCDTVLHALQAACETACGLLRVDQVISARGD